MELFGDKIELKWELVNNVPCGYGYGIGKKYIVVGRFIGGEIWGDLHLFCRLTGKRIMRSQFEASMPHGEYTWYHDDIVETGIYKDGKKHFVCKKLGNRVLEYGFCKNDMYNGYATVSKDGKTYTSPFWKDGVIDGLGCIEDKDGNIEFYGFFDHGVPQYECFDVHPMMLMKYKKAMSDPFLIQAVKCAESIF